MQMSQAWMLEMIMPMDGKPIEGLKSGRRQGRINMIAGYRDGEIIAPFTIAGACNRNVFETWLEFCLIPTLVVGEILIIDNVTYVVLAI